MNLRRKLLTTFGALVLLGLAIAGVTVWATVQWESSNEELQNHYTRSLEVQRIRAAFFRAFKEVSDAVTEGDQDAQQEFEEQIGQAEQDFKVWADLADTEEELQQVQEVLTASWALVLDARGVFDLVEAGREEEAVELMEGQLESENFRSFEATTEQVVASDRSLRDDILAQAESVRRTVQLVLLVASFGILSLLLLIAAYLISDLFRPLRDLERALGDVEKGDLDRRLDEGRADELGAVNRAFNRTVEAISRRERMEALSAVPPDNGDDEGGDRTWQSAPSRVTLHRMVSRLRSKIIKLGFANGSGDDRGELVDELDLLSQVVARITEFGFPLDLNLSRTDVRALLYRVFMRFQDEFAERAVSIELQIAPEVDHAIVDRLKLREAVGELLRNALAALPESGGRLGLRSYLSEDGTELLIEVADEGKGAEQSLIDGAFDPSEPAEDERDRVGLTLTKAIVEEHGGLFEVESEPGEGTYARIRLLLRD